MNQIKTKYVLYYCLGVWVVFTLMYFNNPYKNEEVTNERKRFSVSNK